MAESKTEKQKVQEITEKLEQGIKELFESEKYKTYLNTMSKFHNYSFNKWKQRVLPIRCASTSALIPRTIPLGISLDGAVTGI